MSRLLPPLERVSLKHPEALIRGLAADLRAIIATHGAYRPTGLSGASDAMPGITLNATPADGNPHAPTPTPTAQKRPLRPVRRDLPTEPPRAFSDWLLEACDADVPTRAVALRRLTRMVQERQPEAVQAQEKVLLVGSDQRRIFYCVEWIKKCVVCT